MNKTIFDFLDYKAYLMYVIRLNPAYGHGFKLKIAGALNCQTSYVSKVLNGDANFSLEQAEDLNQLLGHNNQESRFLILLVELARAATVRLKNRLRIEIDEIIEQRERLKERVEQTSTLSAEKQIRYYSQWYYSAIHILITIPEYQTRDGIAKYLNLRVQTVNTALEFLVGCGVATVEGQRYKPGTNRLFLGNDSDMISKLHCNWRIKAMESLVEPRQEDLHYSTVYSLSEADYRIVKNRLVELINEVRDKVKTSNEEKLVNFNMDFYSLKATDTAD